MIREHTNHGPDHETLTDIMHPQFMCLVRNVRPDEHPSRTAIRERRLAQLAAMVSAATPLEEVFAMNGNAAYVATFAQRQLTTGTPAWASPSDRPSAWKRLMVSSRYVLAATYATAYGSLRSEARRAFAREVVTRVVRETVTHGKWLHADTREQDIAQFVALLALVGE